MCKAIKDGGQRCAAHTRLREQNARQRLDGLDLKTVHPSVYSKVSAAWVRAAVEYASTAEGRKDLEARAFQAFRARREITGAELVGICRKGDALRAANAEAARIIKDRIARAARSDGRLLPDDAHWTCQDCHAEGEGDAPPSCPSCSQADVMTFLRTA